MSNTCKAYQNAGDSLQLAGYGLSITGVGAVIGEPIGKIGNIFSTIGTLLTIGTSFDKEGWKSSTAWKSIGIEGLNAIGGEYLKGIEGLNDYEKLIHDQSLNMHLILYDRISN